jgi:hypothetical protein
MSIRKRELWIIRCEEEKKNKAKNKRREKELLKQKWKSWKANSSKKQKGGNAKPLTDHQVKYHKYLQSEEWANIKLDLYDNRGKACEICANTHKLQVHHIHYDNIFNEEPDDLIILCSRCHMKEHNIKRHRNKSNIHS